jgi:putative membrane protein
VLLASRSIKPMISHFSDHAANERTFLAWVRTAIAVMAFGFLVAKFDLFLKIAAHSLAGGNSQTVTLPQTDFGGAVGAVLIIAGTIMVALAAWRFARTRRAIASTNPQPDAIGADLALAAMMAILGVALVLYLAHTLLNGI